MTDTVNVPREALEKAVAVIQHLDPSLQDVGEASFRDLVGSLAAAPKAEPDYRKLVRDVDRMHEDGTIPPEAPKVEQGPVAHVSRKGFTIGVLVWTKEGMGANLPDETKLYTHPAPASDELLEALEVVQGALSYAGQDACSEAVAQANKNQAYHIVSAIIAKHKGPQS